MWVVWEVQERAGAAEEPGAAMLQLTSMAPTPTAFSSPAPSLTLLLQVGGAEAQAGQHHLAREAPQLRRLLLALEQAGGDQAHLCHGHVAQLVRLLRTDGSGLGGCRGLRVSARTVGEAAGQARPGRQSAGPGQVDPCGTQQAHHTQPLGTQQASSTYLRARLIGCVLAKLEGAQQLDGCGQQAGHLAGGGGVVGGDHQRLQCKLGAQSKEGWHHTLAGMPFNSQLPRQAAATCDYRPHATQAASLALL